MRNRIRPLIPITQHCTLLCFILLLFHSCDQLTQSPIAEINNEVISLNSYISKYKDFLQQTSLQDNLANRYTLLHSLIDEVLIIDYMYRTHSDHNIWLLFLKSLSLRNSILSQNQWHLLHMYSKLQPQIYLLQLLQLPTLCYLQY